MGLISDLIARKSIGLQGKELARKFSKRLPRDRIVDSKRVEAEFEILAGDSLDFRRKSNLGFVGTSQLVNSLQWQLVEDGYPEQFAKQIGNQLAIRLATADSSLSPP